jgi:hypothetical protein
LPVVGVVGCEAGRLGLMESLRRRKNWGVYDLALRQNSVIGGEKGEEILGYLALDVCEFIIYYLLFIIYMQFTWT